MINGQRYTIGELEKMINELTLKVEALEAKSGYMDAQSMVDRANAWIARNPKAWAFIKDQARIVAYRGGRFSIKRVLENLRDSRIVNMAEDDYKISNSYSAVFNRLLVRDIPRLAGYVTLRPSKVDYLFPDVMEVYRKTHAA